MYKTDQNNAGFSILEILIALAIGLIVIASLGTAFISQRTAYGVQEQVVEMVQAGRAALDIMSREVMMAGYDPSRSGYAPTQKMQTTDPSAAKFVGIPYNADSSVIDIYADLDGDESTSGTNEHITYAFNSSALQVTRNTNTGSGAQPIAENITAFSVVYRNAMGDEVLSTAPNPTAVIRQVQLSITVRTSRPDTGFSDNGGYRTITLESHAFPRNLN